MATSIETVKQFMADGHQTSSLKELVQTMGLDEETKEEMKEGKVNSKLEALTAKFDEQYKEVKEA